MAESIEFWSIATTHKHLLFTTNLVLLPNKNKCTINKYIKVEKLPWEDNQYSNSHSEVLLFSDCSQNYIKSLLWGRAKELDDYKSNEWKNKRTPQKWQIIYQLSPTTALPTIYSGNTKFSEDNQRILLQMVYIWKFYCRFAVLIYIKRFSAIRVDWCKRLPRPNRKMTVILKLSFKLQKNCTKMVNALNWGVYRKY